MNPDDYWFRWYPTQFSRDTQHLGLAEDAAYRRLIDCYMQNGEPLPDNDAALARMIGIGKDEWAAVAPTVRLFFEASQGKLIHKRCHKELMHQASLKHAYSMRAHSAADARWNKHRENKKQNNGLMLQACLSDASPMLGDARREEKERKKDELGESAPLARSPDGELRGASGNKEVSSSLKRIVAAKGWGQ